MKLRKPKEWTEPHYWPKFCKHDGLPLLLGTEETKREYDDQTGKLMSYRRRFKYCPSWQSERKRHTEYWPASYRDEAADRVEVEP